MCCRTPPLRESGVEVWINGLEHRKIRSAIKPNHPAHQLLYPFWINRPNSHSTSNDVAMPTLREIDAGS